MLAQAHFSQKVLHGVSGPNMLRMLRTEKGVEWDLEPDFFRFGVYIKKEQYEKAAVNLKTQKEVIAIRTRTVPRSFEFNPENAADFLLARFWPGPGPNGP